MRSLSLKLTAVVVLVGLLGVLTVAIYAQQITRREFDEFVLAQTRNEFAERVTEYYQTHATWVGLREYMPRPRLAPRRNNPGGAGDASVEGAAKSASATFALVDMNGCVVLPARPYTMGDCLEPRLVADGEPLLVDDQQVATILIVNPPTFGGIERAFLTATTRALRTAAIAAVAISLVLGLILARYLTHPLKELTDAIHAMTGGELKQEVPIRSQDELGQLTAAFNRMSADVAQANHLRRQMTADIAHDLRNPLGVLSGYIESMRDGVLAPTEARLETMYEEVYHLHHLVDDLWTLALADAGELPLTMIPVPPLELLERTAAAYAAQAEAQEVALVLPTDIPADLLVRVDPERMAQVLGNLVSNALRYTPPGGEIRLAADRVPARANGSGPGEIVELSVRDTGSGVAPDALPYIFERFFRADSARVQENGESGLGLAIARTIVTAHGGDIAATSEPGVATVFRVRLPHHP